MQIDYTLKEKDYLNFQLYHVSTNENVAKQRRNTQIIVGLVVLILGVFFLIFGDKWEGIYLLTGAIPVYYLCGFYARWLYRFTIRKHVSNTYSKNTPRQVKLSILDDTIEYYERGLSSKYKFEELQSIVNIRKYIFFKFNETSFIILPKRELSDENYVTTYIQNYAQKYNIPFRNKIKWKWR